MTRAAVGVCLAACFATACAKQAPTAAAPSTGPLTNDDQKTLYALGYMMGSSLKGLSISPSELGVVTDGVSDSVNGATARVDPVAYRPKVQALAQARAHAAAEIQKQKDAPLLAKAAAEPGAEKLPSGVIVQQLTAGTGDMPTVTDTVKVDYEGRLLSDGTVFDSSLQRGQPATFPLRGIVKCWSEGLQRLKVGEKAKLTCPSDTAYGDQGHPPKIPPGTALTFEVTLKEITKGPQAPAPLASLAAHGGPIAGAAKGSPASPPGVRVSSVSPATGGGHHRAAKTAAR